MARELTSNALAQIVTAIGVAAVIGAGVLLMKSSNVSNEVMFVNQAVSSIRGPLATQSDASYATTANVTTAKLVPDNRMAGANVTSPWGNITIAAANVTGNANDGFTIAYPGANMSLRDCKALVDGVAPSANTVTINATVAKTNTGTLTETTVDAQCAALTGSITFGFSRVGT
jgi:hypothetical protein